MARIPHSLPPPAGPLMQAEERGKGSVPCAVYREYIQALGGWPVFLFILTLFILNVGSTAFSNWWLSYWIKQGSGVREHPLGGLRDGAGWANFFSFM